MTSSKYQTIGHILTWISLIHVSIACIVSALMVAIIIYHIYRNRLKHREKITLILCANIYLVICMYTMTLSETNIETLLGDLHGKALNPWCILRGYWITVSAHVLYCTFVMQAIFRLCRIVYANRRWLQSQKIFLISMPVQTILGSVLLSPLLVWHDITFIMANQYCFILLTDIRSVIWGLSVCYLVPYTCLLMIYIRITIFLRQTAGNIMLEIQRRRQRRDLQAFRRIYINVALLCAISLPGIVMILMALITGVEHPLSHRIIWIGAEISVTILCIEMIFTTPQLKNIILKIRQRNQVTTTGDSIEIRSTL